MSIEISTKLQELPRLPKPELLALWQELFAQPAHPKLRRDLMIPILAFGIQEQAYGELKPTTRKRLHQLAAEQQREQKAPLPLLPSLKPGTIRTPMTPQLIPSRALDARDPGSSEEFGIFGAGVGCLLG